MALDKEIDDYDGEPDTRVEFASEASLPNDMREVGDYSVYKTRSGVAIQHTHLINHIWLADSDIEPLLNAAKELRDFKR